MKKKTRTKASKYFNLLKGTKCALDLKRKKKIKKIQILKKSLLPESNTRQNASRFTVERLNHSAISKFLPGWVKIGRYP